MKIIVILCAFSISAAIGYAQQKSEAAYPLNMNEVFVLDVVIENTMLESQEPCLDVTNRSTLYNIEVNKVVYAPKNNVFDSTSLKKLRYMIAASKYTTLLHNKGHYLITTNFSSSKEYLVLNKILPAEMAGFRFYHSYGFFTNLFECKHKQSNPFINWIAKNR